MAKSQKMNLVTATAAFATMVGMTSMLGLPAFAATTTGPTNGYLIGSQFFDASVVSTSNTLIQEVNNDLSANPSGFVFELNGSFVNYKQFMATSPLSGSTPVATALANYATAHPITLPATITEVNADGTTTSVTFPGQSTSGVSAVSAVNGSLTVTFSSALSTAPTVSDFTVTQSVNGGTATAVTPSAVTMNSAMTVATLTLPSVAATSASQSVVDSVSFNSAAAVSASAFTVTTNVSAANSSVTTAPTFTNSEIVNGTAYTAIENVQDASGNPITTLGTSDFTMNVGSQAVTSTSVTNEGNGTYQVIFIPTTLTVGTNLTANFEVDGVTIGQVGGLSVVGGTVSMTNSAVNFPSTSTLNAGGTYTMTLNLEDAYGNPVVLSSPAITAGSNDLGAKYKITATSTPGQYTVTATAPSTITSVAAPLSFVVESNTSAVATFTSTQQYTIVNEVPATVSAAWSSLPSTLTPTGSYSFSATVTDANGNPVTGLTSAAFGLGYEIAGQTSPTSLPSVSTVAGKTAGVYTVSFAAPDVTANYQLVLTVSGVNSSASSSFTPGTAPTASNVGSGSTVTWPASLSDGNTATFSVNLLDTNGNPLVLPTGYTVNLVEQTGGTITGTSNSSGTDTSFTATNSSVQMNLGTSTGQYTVTLTPSATGSASGSFQVQVWNGSTFVAQVGSTQTYTLQAGTPEISMSSVAGVKASTTTSNSIIAVAGEAYSLPVTVADSNGIPVTGLASSNFGLTYDNATVPVSLVTAVSGTPGSYMVDFTLPSGSTSSTLSVSVNGNSIGSATVTVAPPAVSASSVTSKDISADTQAPANTVALPGSGAALATSGSYAALVTVNGPYLTSSDFAVTYGSSSTNLVTSAAPVSANSDQYVVVFSAPSTASTTPQALNFSFAGQTASAGTYTTSAAVSATKSSVTWMGGTQLTAGQSVTVVANVEDANGNPITIASPSKAQFGVFYGSTNADAAFADNLVTGVTATSTSGQYEVTFAQKVATSTAQAFTMYVNPQGLNYSNDTLIGTSGNFTVVAGSPASIAMLPTTASVYGQTYGTVPLTAIVVDANGNPVEGVTVDFTVTPTTGGTVTTSATTGSNGQATATYTGPASTTAGVYATVYGTVSNVTPASTSIEY